MQVGLTVKGELCELMDTLLDLQQQYAAGPRPPSDPTSVSDPNPPLPQRIQPLLPLLLSSYGATLSKADQSLLRVLLHINDIIYHSDAYQQQLLSPQPSQDTVGAGTGQNTDAGSTADAARDGLRLEEPGTDVTEDEAGGTSDGPMSARLQGPLAQVGYADSEMPLTLLNPAFAWRSAVHKHCFKVVVTQQRLSPACQNINRLHCETANGSLNQLYFIIGTLPLVTQCASEVTAAYSVVHICSQVYHACTIKLCILLVAARMFAHCCNSA